MPGRGVLERDREEEPMSAPAGTRHSTPLTPRAHLLMITFRVWLAEVPLAAVNAFVLMDRVYAPRVGALHAHQIAMATRILLIVVLAYVINRLARDHRPLSLLAAGAFWMTLWLVFEWGGSLLIGRPVQEILVGWHVEQGYLWPYVLLTYLLAPLLVGVVRSRWARAAHRAPRGKRPRRR